MSRWRESAEDIEALWPLCCQCCCLLFIGDSALPVPHSVISRSTTKAPPEPAGLGGSKGSEGGEFCHGLTPLISPTGISLVSLYCIYGQFSVHEYHHNITMHQTSPSSGHCGFSS